MHRITFAILSLCCFCATVGRVFAEADAHQCVGVHIKTREAERSDFDFSLTWSETKKCYYFDLKVTHVGKTGLVEVDEKILEPMKESEGDQLGITLKPITDST